MLIHVGAVMLIVVTGQSVEISILSMALVRDVLYALDALLININAGLVLICNYAIPIRALMVVRALMGSTPTLVCVLLVTVASAKIW